MNTLALVKFIWRSSPRLLVRLSRNLEEMCRSAFVSALVAEGIGLRLRAGPVPLDALHDELGEAGFANVQREELIPNFWVFIASSDRGQ